ncbi:MAG: PIN domain-containing protein [Chloroflexota bacterium]
MGPVTVLDTQALVALLAAEPAASEVEAILRGRDGIASISAVTVAEVMDVLVRRHARRVETAGDYVTGLLAGGLEVVPVDEEIGRLAGVLRSRHWDSKRRPVSMADCIVLATAMTVREPLATSDRPLIAAARAEGHPVVALLDSRGEASE